MSYNMNAGILANLMFGNRRGSASDSHLTMEKNIVDITSIQMSLKWFGGTHLSDMFVVARVQESVLEIHFHNFRILYRAT